MPLTKNEKPRKEIALDVFEVNAFSDKKYQPYFNVFHYEGANYAEQKLGELFGVIQILDDSKNSAYLPNVIAQVLKKEFFSDLRRTTDKAFEAALHKANLALTDLAQHEIVEWMGKLNAVIGVVEKNNFHFTQAGGGRILLIREKLISDVTRGLDDGEGAGHPIKTFSNISSGKVTSEDKLIFCTETVFDSFSWEDLKRHCNTFNSTEFDNLFKSTLMSEAQQAGALVINVGEKLVQPMALPLSNESDDEEIPQKNFFGADLTVPPKAAFPKLSAPSPATPPLASAPPTLPASQPANLLPTQIAENELAPKIVTNRPESQSVVAPDATEKTGPTEDGQTETEIAPFEKEQVLYIKETELANDQPEKTTPAWREKLRQLLFEIKLFVKTHWPKVRRDLSRMTNSVWLGTKRLLALGISKFKIALAAIKKKPVSVTPAAPPAEQTPHPTQPALIPDRLVPHQTATQNPLPPQSQLDVRPPEANARQSIFPSPSLKSARSALQSSVSSSISTLQKAGNNLQQMADKHVVAKLKNIRPTSPNGRNHASSLTTETPANPIWFRKKSNQIIGGLLLVGIVLFMLFSGDNIRPNGNNDSQKESLSNRIIDQKNPENQGPADLSVQSLNQLNFPVKQMVAMRDELFLLSENGDFYRFDLQTNQPSEVELPADLRDVKSISRMSALNLIFLISPNAVFSFSPVTDKFQTNVIDLPSGMEVADVDSYLTYIYILDKNSDQIYQYPRAGAGFGQRKDWLKNPPDLTKASGLSIDGAIYVTFEDGSVKKYFQHKEDSGFSFTPSEGVKPTQVVADHDHDPVYLLDADNGKIIEIQKSGQVMKETADYRLQGARDFWYDFKSKDMYMVDKDNNLLKFPL